MKGCSFTIGWASIDITPRLPAPLVGQFYKRTAESVRDPLAAVALAIESHCFGHSVIVACDLCTINETTMSRLRARLATYRDGPDPKCVLLCATHIHTGPYTSNDAMSQFWGETFKYSEQDTRILTPNEYADYLVDKLFDVVCQAWQDRKTGTISRTTEYAVTAHNRRSMYSDGTSVMYGSTSLSSFTGLEGPEDNGIELLYFKDDEGKLTGIVVNQNCPAQVLEHKSFITADIWGEVRRAVAGIFGCNVYILPLLGSGGDLSPRDLVRHQPDPPGMSGGVMFHEVGASFLADRILKAAVRGLELAELMPDTDVVIKHESVLLSLPIRQVTKEQAKTAEVACARIQTAIEPDMMRLSFAMAIVNRYNLQQQRQFMDVEVNAIRIGDIVLVTNPFELFLEYGHRIKARSAAKQTIVVQLACGYGGYLPTARAEAGGGYSAMISNGFFGHEAGDLLVDSTVEMIASLF